MPTETCHVAFTQAWSTQAASSANIKIVLVNWWRGGCSKSLTLRKQTKNVNCCRLEKSPRVWDLQFPLSPPSPHPPDLSELLECQIWWWKRLKGLFTNFFLSFKSHILDSNGVWYSWFPVRISAKEIRISTATSSQSNNTVQLPNFYSLSNQNRKNPIPDDSERKLGLGIIGLGQVSDTRQTLQVITLDICFITFNGSFTARFTAR